MLPALLRLTYMWQQSSTMLRFAQLLVRNYCNCISVLWYENTAATILITQTRPPPKKEGIFITILTK